MSAKRYAGLLFEEVVEQYAQSVHTLCYVRLQNPQDADDCFQNTFVKLFTSSKHFNDTEHLKAWLLRVASNQCKNFLRDNRRHLPLEAAESASLYREDDHSDISWALMRVEPAYREVLYLHYCEKYKINEIADILSRNPNTVKTMLKRGREKLRKIYGGDS